MAALDWSQCPAVESVPGKVGGAWVFKNTRTAVSTVFENLQDMSVDELMEEFGVTRGWGELENGELPAEAEAAGFEVFVTAAKNLGYQQNLKDRKIVVVFGKGRWRQCWQRSMRRARQLR